MKQPFEIKFDFPLANSDLVVSLRATAELHHSKPYFMIDHFRFASRRQKRNDPSILPPQEILLGEYESTKQWIHRDSGRPSLLSISIGKAIEKVMK